MSSLPLQRSLAKAEKEGYIAGIVERFIPFPKPYGHHVDLFGLFDAVAVDGKAPGVLGIQACRDADVAAHLDKTKLPDQANALVLWKQSGNRAVIWGWGERVKRDENGKQATLKDGRKDSRKVWTCREVVL